MLHSIFKSIEQFIKRNKHKNKLLISLANSHRLAQMWNFLRFYLYKKPGHDFNHAIEFFKQNSARIQAVTDILADEKSKKVYNEIIKYRQTWSKKDFPLQYCDENQYFIDEIKLNENEVFIDCGAYIRI